MNLRFMQRIDFWLGIPLCFVASTLKRVSALFIPNKAVKPKKILFIELSEMGSAIIAYSSMKKAKADFGAELYFMTFRRNVESIALLGLIPEENVFSIEDQSLLSFSKTIISSLLRIWKLKIDTTIDCELFSRCTSLLTILSGAQNRVGFHRHTNEGLYRGEFLTHKVLYNTHQHMSANFLALIASLQAPANENPLVKINLREIDSTPPLLTYTSQEKEAVLNLLPDFARNKRLIAFNPDPGALPLRGWPLDRFVALSQQIISEFPDTVIVVVGLNRSKTYAQAIEKAVDPSRFVDLTGKTKNMRDLTILLDICSLLITNDSGPAHLASLTSAHSIVLFGPESPSLYGPLSKNSQTFFANLSCSPCYSAANHRRTTCTDNKCLQAISLDQIAAAVKSELSAEGSRL